MDRTIVTIDPGAKGGICVYTKKGRIYAAKMPSTVPEIKEHFEHLISQHEDILVFIEKVQHWMGDDEQVGKKIGIAKLVANFTEVKTTIAHLGLIYVRVHPATWQARLGLRKEKGVEETNTEKKNRHKVYAQNCFPEITVTHDTADALCLVQFALWMIENQPDWVKDNLENLPPPKNLFR